MAVRVLGIDPGLTRCGVGVVDVEPNRTARLVDVSVIRSSPGDPIEKRLLTVATGLAELLDRHQPDAVALERVFAQHNLSTVMGTAQISGVALFLSAQRGLAVGLHTPSEVKASITGYGAADKAQVGAMVTRILKLAAPPKPADAADALAIAICHAWRTALSSYSSSGGTLPSAPGQADGLTPAQKAWRAAESGTRMSVAPRSLKR